MTERQKIEVGNYFWVVVEHLYDHEKIEYCVCEGIVWKILPNREPEICLHGRGPDGYVHLWYYKVAEIGKKVFLTSREAAMYARELTEKYESTGLFRSAEREPLRRTFEKYLKEPEDTECTNLQ